MKTKSLSEFSEDASCDVLRNCAETDTNSYQGDRQLGAPLEPGLKVAITLMQNRLVDWEHPDGALVLGAWREDRNPEDTRPEKVPGRNRDVS